MEQYLDANVKRYVQKQLFSHIRKTKTILGLAGLHPEKYLKVLPKHKQCVLVDFNPVNALVRKNSLIGEFDLLTNQPAEYSPVNFVDCDFCRSIINNGMDLKYIYYKMRLSPVKNKYIAFTFGLIGESKEKTMEWLAVNFPELNIPLNYSFIVDTRCKETGFRKYVMRAFDGEKYLNIYRYRDSGDHMISGLIKII
mgnify:FL=1